MKKKTKEENPIEVIYVTQEKESVSPILSFIIIFIAFFTLYFTNPEVKSLVNPWLKYFKESLKSLNGEIITNVKQEKKQEVKLPSKDTNSTSNKSISISVLFINDVSIGSRFIGMAEGNYILRDSGIYYNTSNYSGHIEPSGAVPSGTINRSFCSTVVTTSRKISNNEKIIIGNNKCLKMANVLVQEIKSNLNWGEQLTEPKLSLFLNTVDLGNQARPEVKKNMYTTEIPKVLSSSKGLTLADITIMRSNSFYSKESKGLKSALNTIPGLHKAAKQYCGNNLHVNIIRVDQARRVSESNKALRNIGMGLVPMTRKQIMEQVCVKTK